jgi:hypothetical protein
MLRNHIGVLLICNISLQPQEPDLGADGLVTSKPYTNQ